MALSLFDRVRETTTTAGTGTITLAGAVTGYQSFSVVGNGNVTYYCIAGQGTSEWEVGIGTYTSAGTTLSRDTVLSSSNSGSLVVFSAGTKDVFVTYPSERAIVGSVTSIASASTITPDSTYAQYEVTALAVPATIAAPSGTPIDGQKLLLRIIDNGTARALTWTTTAGAYRARNVVLPTTTVVSSQMYVGCIYNAADNYWDVLSVSNGSSATVGTVTSVDVTGGTTGLTTSGGPITTGGTITLAGTLAAANGGTGQTSYAVGDLLYASTTTALSKLADVATGNAVISGGVGVAPSYGKIGLTTHVSGTLPVGNGGTGLTSTPSNGQLDIGNGTGFTRTTLSAGSNVTITNGVGSITIAASSGASALTLSNKTAAYTVVAGDLGTVINCTANTFTVSLTAAATLGSGFNCWVWNTGTGVITIDPNAAETIDGVSTLVLRQGEGTQIVCNGTNWETGGKKTMRVYAENTTATSTRPIASGSGGIALGSSATASGAQGLALGYNTTASSTAATALGQNSGQNGSQAVTGSGAMALGGSYASGTDSIAAAIGNNTSTYGAQGTGSVALSGNAKATSNYSIAIGYATTSSGLGSVALGGYGQTQATGSGSIAIGGGANVTGAVAAAQNSVAIGDSAYVPTTKGKYAFSSDGAFVQGGAQYGVVVLRRQTTDATASVLSSDGLAASGTNQLVLPNNSAYAFDATIVARQQAAGGTASAAWQITGLIRREGTAASTTLVASTTTVISNVPGWTIAVSADTTNGGLTVTATGAAATNIRWVATVQTTEATYA
jgi:hypothetical protein